MISYSAVKCAVTEYCPARIVMGYIKNKTRQLVASFLVWFGCVHVSGCYEREEKWYLLN